MFISKICLVCTITAALLAGCAPINRAELAMCNANRMAEQSGSPYRLEKLKDTPQGMLVQRTVIGTRAATVADELLQRDIVTDILAAEQKRGARAPLKLTEFRQIEPGPKQFVEAWVFDRNNDTVVYLVTMARSTQGGADYQVSGPWE